MKKGTKGNSKTVRLLREFDRVEDGLAAHLDSKHKSRDAARVLSGDEFLRHQITLWFEKAAARGLYDDEALAVTRQGIADMDRQELEALLKRLLLRIKEASAA